MPSPFPGMDPYLDRHWPDVRLGLFAEARRSLNSQLPPGLVARIDERTFPEPSASVPPSDPLVERFLRVSDRAGNLITVIEIISPLGKFGPRVEWFQKTRADRLAAGVHFVEIDLFRSGSLRLPAMHHGSVPYAPTACRAIVWTAGAEGSVRHYPIGLRDALPDIPIPLRHDMSPATLPLQKMLTAAYRDGGYDRSGTYSHPLHPPLSDADNAWAKGLMAAWSL